MGFPFKTEPTPMNSTALSEWKKRNKERVNESNRNYMMRKKMSVFDKLGGKCAECGFDDWRTFHIDHINGGGNQERKKLHRTTIWTKILEGSDEYQLLCANCHCIKSHDRKEYSGGK